MKISAANCVTLVRLVLAFVLFGLLSFYSSVDDDTHIILAISFWVLLVGVTSDALDGYLARSLNQITSFGRVVDPVVDKITVLGAFIFLAGPQFYDYSAAPTRIITDVQVWMVVVILIRELLVSAIRSHGEAKGIDFSADWTGKIKMVVQSTTVCYILGQLAWYPDDEYPRMALGRTALVWTTVIVTGLSLITYAGRARQFLFTREALAGAGPPSHTDADDDPNAES
jgi:CDP-diacylglycerol--glycerol-3-phosphate 3-phosphatidyltransferase